MIEIKNLSKYYSANGITNLGLRNINLKLNKNEIVAITGDSGSGKSTLLNIITKLDTFDEGEIYYKGNETSYFSILDMDDFRKNKVGMIFQNYNIIDSYTVLENVMIPLLLLGKPRKEAKERALELISKVGLSGKEKNRGTKLSGGEKQRCVIARALASDCEILACDEPTGNLDSKTGKEIIELLKEVSKDKLVLIVTHDYSLVESIVTRKIRISDGEIVEDVIFEEKEPEPNQALDLDYQPLSRHVDLTIAKNNIIFTPKKTIFLGSVIFVISICVLFLFQLIHSSYNQMYVYNPYGNKQENRLYVYSKDRKPLDLEKLETVSTTYEINPFYEEKTFTLGDSNYVFYSSSCYYNAHLNYTLQEGRLPQKDNELIIIVPEKHRTLGSLKTLLNQNLIFSENDKYNDSSRKVTLVGYGTTKQSSQITFVGNEEFSSRIKSISDISLSYNGTHLSGTNIIYTSNSLPAPFTLYMPLSYKDTNLEIELIIADLYEISTYEVVYDETITYPTLHIQDKNTNQAIEAFEVSVYSDSPSKTKAKLEALGFLVDYPFKLDTSFSLDVFINNLVSYALMVLASVMLIIVFYITYFILAKVYVSKKKDYDILRTLGVTKRDMKKIVTYEVLGIGLFSIIISYIIGILCIYLIPKLSYFRGLKLTTTLLYFVILTIFIYAVGRRFNKKLFKFSVTTSLKGDDFFD